MLNHEDLDQAKSIVYRHMQPTPTYAWPLLGEALGCEAWVKHENHTPIGAFKVRGGLVYLHEISADGSTADLVTATRGNHGQSIPYAARQYGRTVHVFVPEGNSTEKNAAMRAWGATLHVQGVDFDEAREAAEIYSSEQGGHLVPSFSEYLVRGVATYAAELFEVVADRADAFAQSFEAGQIRSTATALTFADGMATRVPHPQAFDVLRHGLARVVRVSDAEVAEAMRLLYRTTHNIAEGAGAAATAAAAQERRVNAGKRVAVILSGGNVDANLFAQVLAGRTPSVA